MTELFASISIYFSYLVDKMEEIILLWISSGFVNIPGSRFSLFIHNVFFTNVVRVSFFLFLLTKWLLEAFFRGSLSLAVMPYSIAR